MVHSIAFLTLGENEFLASCECQWKGERVRHDKKEAVNDWRQHEKLAREYECQLSRH